MEHWLNKNAKNDKTLRGKKGWVFITLDLTMDSDMISKASAAKGKLNKLNLINIKNFGAKDIIKKWIRQSTK